MYFKRLDFPKPVGAIIKTMMGISLEATPISKMIFSMIFSLSIN
jgi:hypothetical protein